MAARSRDVVAVGVLAAGGIAAALAWHPLGRWAALGAALAAVVLAGVVYLLRPSAFPWRDDEHSVLDDDEDDPALDDSAWRSRTVSTPRRAAAPRARSSRGPRSR